MIKRFSNNSYLSLILTGSSFLLQINPAYSQVDDTDYKNAIDNRPIISARADGQAGALSTSADLFDAFYYNPAGISGNAYVGGSNKSMFVKQVLFPRFGVLANSSAISLKSEFESNGATNSSDKGSALIKNHDGSHQYARISFSPVALFIGNLGVAPIIDQQISAIPTNSEESDVKFHYRTINGAMLGTSLKDSREIVSLGVSTMVGTIDDTEGTAPYKDMVDVDKRKEILASNKKSYTSSQVNAGLMIKIPKKWNPTIAVVARNMGNTENKSTDAGAAPLTFKEDLTLGVGVAPQVLKIGQWHLNLEGGSLTDQSVDASSKLRIGSEFTFGNTSDSRALLGLRTGYNSNGATFGAHLNVGLISIEAASHCVNTSSSSGTKKFERRSTFVLYVDAVSF